MAYFPTTKIEFSNSTSIDAFARLRVSQPVTIFDSATVYDSSSSYWEYAVSGSSTTAFNLNKSSITLSVSALNDLVIRQTRQYFPNQPGKSQLIVMTGIIGGTPAAGGVKRWGYFDARNGVFFELNSLGLAAVIRSFTGGVISETKVYQTNWNIDTFLGTGISNFNLDTTKANIYFIDLEWLGVGRVRFGCFDSDGFPQGGHAFKNANNLGSVYMSTANLPVRYQMSVTGALANLSNTSMETICTAVITEGGFNEARSRPLSQDSGTAANGFVGAAGIEGDLIAIRPLTSFKGSINRATANISSMNILANLNPIRWRLIWNPTITATAVWVPVGGDSMMEYATFGLSSPSTPGGQTIASGYVPGGAQQAGAGETTTDILTRMPLTVDIAGTGQISAVLRVTAIGGASNIWGSLSWREFS